MNCLQPSAPGSDGNLFYLSFFNPPIIGEETHDEDGAGPPTGEPQVAPVPGSSKRLAPQTLMHSTEP